MPGSPGWEGRKRVPGGRDVRVSRTCAQVPPREPPARRPPRSARARAASGQKHGLSGGFGSDGAAARGTRLGGETGAARSGARGRGRAARRRRQKVKFPTKAVSRGDALGAGAARASPNLGSRTRVGRAEEGARRGRLDQKVIAGDVAWERGQKNARTACVISLFMKPRAK